MSIASFPIEETSFERTLHDAGYKVTPARLALLTLLRENNKPMSPQTIVEKLSKEIDQATIYRILKNLKDANIIRQVDFQKWNVVLSERQSTTTVDELGVQWSLFL